jgi:hypothetical protein
MRANQIPLMKNKNLFLLTSVFFLCLLLFACRKEIGGYVETKPDISSAKLEAAKIWNARFLADHISENANQINFVSVKPLWEKSWSVKNESGKEFIVVPTDLNHINELEITIKRVFLFEMQDNSVKNAGIYEFVGLNYDVENNVNNLIKNHDSNTIPGFNGAAVRYDLSYRWIDGKIFEDGKFVHDNAIISGKTSLASSGSPILAPLYLSTLVGDIKGEYKLVPYKYLYKPATRMEGSGSGSGSGLASNMGGTLSGVTITAPPSGGGGGSNPGGNLPPIINTGSGGIGTIPNNSASDSDGGITVNGGKPYDWDLSSNCQSFKYVPVTSNQAYQVCAVKDMRWDYNTVWQSGTNQYSAYVVGSFTKNLYFEFPRIRANGTVISACDAAKATALAKDQAENILESQIESSPPALSPVQITALRGRFMRILSAKMEEYGGRVNTTNNYPNAAMTIQSYSKTITACDCNSF